MSAATQAISLRCATLHPYERSPQCVKCGGRQSALPVWMMRLLGWYSAPISMVFCAGGKEPTKEVDVLPGMKVEVEFMCAGVTEEHLHRHCHRCGHTWLMRTWEHG